VAAFSGLAVVMVGTYDVAGLAGLLAFTGVVFVQFLMSQHQPDRTWYDGRVAAESVKHLAWRYAMRAAPFDDDAGVDGRFLKRVNDTLAEVKNLTVGAAGADQITDWMREVRASALLERKAIYVTERIDDQRNWYRDRSKHNKAVGLRWRVALYVVGAAGAAAGLAKFVGVVNVDLMGFAATAVAAVAAWSAIKQYDTLTLTYAFASQELASAHSAAAVAATDDDAWSTFVNDTEDAISREHRSWRASRTG